MWMRATLRQAPPTALKVLAWKRSAIGRSSRFTAARVLAMSNLPPRRDGEGAERQGDASRRLAVDEAGDLEAGAPEVADQPVRVRRARQDAHGGEVRLLLSGEDADLQAGSRPHLAAEGLAIGGVAHGGGGGDEHLVGLGGVDEHLEAAQRVRGRLATPSAESRPVSAMSRPRPASTFSL